MAAPPAGFAKIHVDAGLMRSGEGGAAAAVCRDSNGQYLGSSSLVVNGVRDVATIEAIACRDALSLADDLLLQSFVVATDSKQVATDNEKGTQGSFGQIIKEIKLRSENFNCTLRYEGRASNFEAHSLGKYSLSLARGRHVWMVQPHDIFCIPNYVTFEQ